MPDANPNESYEDAKRRYDWRHTSPVEARMPDASPMDPAAVTEAIAGLERWCHQERQRAPRGNHEVQDKVDIVISALRAALADTRRVDWLLKTLVSYKAKDLTLCVEWWLPDGLGVKTLDREAIDAAMKAEEQVHG